MPHRDIENWWWMTQSALAQPRLIDASFIDGGSISFADRDRARGFESYSKNLIPQPILRVSLLVCELGPMLGKTSTSLWFQILLLLGG